MNQAVAAKRQGQVRGQESAHVRQAATDVQVRTRAEHDRGAVLVRERDVLGAGTDHVHEKWWLLAGKGTK